ncbi:MAG: DUF3606 domain-containing protein [Stutzerimonas stutzeri]|nr:MAG: DUF3606 domain-containing protein [Stutzerimonas stutzeri]
MSENSRSSGVVDRSRIHLNDSDAVKYWTQKWAVTEEQLRRAVREAGDKPEAVALQLGRPL